jgi:tRNA A37 threonylcarbamoyladenosine dehydratase
MTDMQNTFSSSMEQRNLRFSGVARLYTTPSKNNKKNGEESTDDDHLRILDRLQASSVVVVGLGGVGSWAAEALCRSGVGHLTLVDLDDICISNTNRQLHALESSVGKMKIDVMKERLQQINPDCNIHLVHDFVSAGNVGTLLQNIDPPATACLDAIDGSRSKTALIAACARQRIPVVTCGGSAGRTDPSKFVCEDLTRATGDPLLSTCRRELRRDYGFEEGVRFRTSDPTKNRSKLPRKWNIQAVYSTEPQKSLPGGGTDGASSLRRCDGALGTACFVTGTSGFLAAGKVVDMIATNKLKPPKTFPGNVALNPKT